METHIKESNLTRIMNSVCPQWSFVSNHSEDDDGRIIMFWKALAALSLLHKSRQEITCEVVYPGLPTFTMSAIYADNTVDEKKILWDTLLDVKASLSLHNSPWIIGGDFNEIIHCAEHSSPAFNNITPQMIEFKDCIDELEVRDLRFHGPPFTWSNKQSSDPISKKLDRVMINEEWLLTFPNSLAQFMLPDFSDHTPSLVNLEAALPVAGTRPFKFYNFLTAHPDFLATITEGWEISQPDSWSLSSLNKKQKILKKYLKKLHKHNYSEIQKRVGECNQNLKDLLLESLSNPFEETFLAEKLCTEKLHHLRRVEEAYFHQKSRIQWLKEGD